GGADRPGTRSAAARPWRLVVIVVLLVLIELIVLIDLVGARAGVAVDRLAPIVAVRIPRVVGVRFAFLFTAVGRDARVDTYRPGWRLIGVSFRDLRRLAGAVGRPLRTRTARHAVPVAHLRLPAARRRRRPLRMRNLRRCEGQRTGDRARHQ